MRKLITQQLNTMPYFTCTLLASPHTPPARSPTRDIQHFGHRPRQGHLHLHLIIPCPETLPRLHSQETLSVVVELCENVRVPHALLPQRVTDHALLLQRVTERAGRAPRSACRGHFAELAPHLLFVAVICASSCSVHIRRAPSIFTPLPPGHQRVAA